MTLNKNSDEKVRASEIFFFFKGQFQRRSQLTSMLLDWELATIVVRLAALDRKLALGMTKYGLCIWIFSCTLDEPPTSIACAIFIELISFILTIVFKFSYILELYQPSMIFLSRKWICKLRQKNHFRLCVKECTQFPKLKNILKHQKWNFHLESLGTSW